MFSKSIVRLIQRAADKWRTNLALPFETVLPATTVVVAAALEKIVFRERFFSPGGHTVGFSGSGAGRGWGVSRGCQPRDRLLRPAEREDPLATHRRLLQGAAAFVRRAA